MFDLFRKLLQNAPRADAQRAAAPATQAAFSGRANAAFSGHAKSRATAAPKPAARDERASLYGPQLLPVTPQLAAAMREQVGAAVAQGLVGAPTAAQWEMILSDHPATCVVAGAGSGKSTTLILRVVFMLCHLQIRPDDLTVISFTRASCAELREKLLRVLSFAPWKDSLAPDDALNLQKRCETMVSTFHSALYRVAKRSFGKGAWFDFLGQNASAAPAEHDVIDNPAVAGGKLNPLQSEQLQSAYRALFNDDMEFRRAVLAMLRLECDRHTLLEKDQGEAKALRVASARDATLTRMVGERWGSDWMLPGVDPTPFVAFRIDNHPFYANGRVEKTGMPIFLSLDALKNGAPLFDQAETIGEGRSAFSVSGALRVKQHNVARYCDSQALHLNSTDKIEWLKYRLAHLADGDFRRLTAPAFPVHLRGEPAASDLVAAFYTQAAFIESLGMEVAQACQRMLSQLQENTLEWHFAKALGRFWPAFESALAAQAVPIRTFNRAFLDLGERAAHPVAISPETLRPFTHLLVDEFQDISPQIVSWLRAMQRRVRAAGQQPTLMAIGDDWQSIYGWRGSAPELFIDFARHFPVHPQLGAPRQCRMMENFRSVAPILTDAQRIIDAVPVKIDKRANPVLQPQASDHGVRLIKGVSPRQDAVRIAQEILQQLDFVNTLPKADKNKVLVLSRANATLKKVRSALQQQQADTSGVRFETFHSAKGLQGEVAILCDNCTYEEIHALRNGVYQVSGLFKQSYDQAARDEALRLAYVAVTRGIRRVLWFVDTPKGATHILSKTE